MNGASRVWRAKGHRYAKVAAVIVIVIASVSVLRISRRRCELFCLLEDVGTASLQRLICIPGIQGIDYDAKRKRWASV